MSTDLKKDDHLNINSGLKARVQDGRDGAWAPSGGPQGTHPALKEAEHERSFRLPSGQRRPGGPARSVSLCSIIYQEVPFSAEDVQTALNTLSLPEYEEYQRFRLEKRRREWLAGRLAAKKAVRKLSENDPKRDKVDLNEIILKPSNGRPPSILLPSFPDWGPKVDISLSHSGDWAIACARFKSTPTFRIGIDIEKVVTPDLDILPIVFTLAEQDSILSNPLNYFRFWTAKEAVLKALGLGFTIDLRELEVIDTTHLKKENSLQIRMRPNTYRVQFAQWHNYMVAYCEIP